MHISHRVAEAVDDLCSLAQALHGGASVVQAVGVAAVGGQHQRAVLACVTASICDYEGVSGVFVAVVS